MTKVRAILAVLALALAAPAVADHAEFCEGFKAGYVTGYKQAAKTSLAPLTPLCPLQPLKRMSDPKSDYEHGYTIGYRKGVGDGSKRGY